MVAGGVFFGSVVGGDFLFPQQQWLCTQPRGSVISRILTTDSDWIGIFQPRKEREFLQKVPTEALFRKAWKQVFKP